MEHPPVHGHLTAWKLSFQRRYLSHLVATLRLGRIEHATSFSARSRAVKLAADLSLAMTARGRTAWSKAIIGKYPLRPNKFHRERRIISSRWKLPRKRRSVFAKLRPCKPNDHCKNPASTGNGEAGGTVASRMQTLRALVPGSRALDTPVFLTEAADYIVALEMQVQAMHALAQKHSNSITDSACQVRASRGIESRGRQSKVTKVGFL